MPERQLGVRDRMNIILCAICLNGKPTDQIEGEPLIAISDEVKLLCTCVLFCTLHFSHLPKKNVSLCNDHC